MGDNPLTHWPRDGRGIRAQFLCGPAKGNARYRKGEGGGAMASLGSSGVSCAGSSASSRDGCDTLWSVNPPGLCFRACTLAGLLCLEVHKHRGNVHETLAVLRAAGRPSHQRAWSRCRARQSYQTPRQYRLLPLKRILVYL